MINEGIYVMEENIKYCITIFLKMCKFIEGQFGILCSALFLFIILMFLDYTSEIFATKKEAIEHPRNKKYDWNSKKGLLVIYKKVGYIFAILVALSADYVVLKFVNEIGISYNFNSIFGFLILLWFILTELLSILENVERMGVTLPKFLSSTLTNIRDDIENVHKE